MSRISCFVISSQKTHSLSFLNGSIFFTQCEYRTSMRSTLTTQCFYLISSCVLHTKAQIMQNSQAAQQVQMMQAPHGLALPNSAPQYPVPVQNSPATGQNMQTVQNTQTSQNINYTSVVSQLSDTFLRKPPSINGKLIIFNPIFRAASHTIQKMMKQLQKINKFNLADLGLHPEDETNNEGLVEKIDKAFMDQTSEQTKNPTLILKTHTIFDMKQYGRPNPAWITFIRNPVDMFISEWYFCRFGSAKFPKGDDFMCDVPEGTEKMSLGECLRAQNPACMKSQFEWHQFMCGDASECLGNRNAKSKIMKRAVQATKAAILNKWYSAFKSLCQAPRFCHFLTVSDRIFFFKRSELTKLR